MLSLYPDDENCNDGGGSYYSDYKGTCSCTRNTSDSKVDICKILSFSFANYDINDDNNDDDDNDDIDDDT
jgi:hypothetical protein